MNDKQLIELLKTLSGVQAWALSLDKSMPDYLHDDLNIQVNEVAGLIEKRMASRSVDYVSEVPRKRQFDTHIFDTSKLMPKPDLSAPLEHPWRDFSQEVLEHEFIDILTDSGITFSHFKQNALTLFTDESGRVIYAKWNGWIARNWRPSVKKSL